MKITEKWLMDHATKHGSGWTREQLRLIGVAWPPPRGWKRAMIGVHVAEDLARRFEDCGRLNRRW